MKIQDFFKTKIQEVKEVDLEFGVKENLQIQELKNTENIFCKKTKKSASKTNEKHYIGHRARLKEKVLQATNLEKIETYELLEILLTYCIPRVDVKPLAKELLENFRNIKGLITADQSAILNIKHIGANSVVFFKIINELFCRTYIEEIQNEINLSSPEQVMEYCSARMSNLRYEQFRVIFLNRKNKLIQDVIIQNGTIDKSSIFPKELIKKAMEINAGAMILVHNHPSGDPSPSKADIEITQVIKQAASLMDIFVYDHIIIGKTKHFSMKSNNLI